MTSTLGDSLVQGETYDKVAFPKERLQKSPGLFGSETQRGIVVSSWLHFLFLQNRVTKPRLCSGKGHLAYIDLQGLATVWELAHRGLTVTDSPPVA